MIRDVAVGPLEFITAEGELKETLGDALEAVGSALVAGERRPRPFNLTLPIAIDSTEGATALASAEMLRRQVRGLMENPKARLRGLWLAIAFDPVLDGWLLVGGADLSYTEAGITLADFTLELTDCYRVGDRNTHRPARMLELLDRRLSTTWRDTLGKIASTDFASLSTLSRFWLPPGATDIVGADGKPVASSPIATKDGTLQLVTGRAHHEVLTFEQASNQEGKAGVVIRDRRGTITAPAGGPDAAWETIYGPAQALTAADVPVMENGLCRVRYDGTNIPGFRVDVWTGAAWVEQGKVTFGRRGTGAGTLDTLVSAAVREWTPDRAVLEIVMRLSTNAASRERVLLTLQRGWTGLRAEIYPAAQADGSAPGADVFFTPAVIDTHNSLVKIDAANAGVIKTTVETGTQFFAPGDVGAGAFNGENIAVLLRQGAAYSVTIAVLQASARLFAGAGSSYGAARNVAQVYRDASNYLSVHFGFHAQQAAQIAEAEAIVNPGGTRSVVADASASGGSAVEDSQAAENANTLVTGQLTQGRYAVLARVKVVNAGATGSIMARNADNSGNTGVKTFTNTAFAWVYVGELAQPLAPTNVFGINAWRSVGTGNVRVDRVELVKLEDRTAAVPTYDGARDHGQAALADAQQLQTIVPRT